MLLTLTTPNEPMDVLPGSTQHAVRPVMTKHMDETALTFEPNRIDGLFASAPRANRFGRLSLRLLGRKRT